MKQIEGRHVIEVMKIILQITSERGNGEALVFIPSVENLLGESDVGVDWEKAQWPPSQDQIVQWVRTAYFAGMKEARNAPPTAPTA